jgi:two-component system, NarL family, response regulator NreC
MKEVRILVADDHGLVRLGIRALLSADPKLKITAEAADGKEAVRLAQEQHPDIAVLDVTFKELTGIDAITQIAEKSPQTSIIVLSSLCDERSVGRALRAGAKSYVLKDSAEDDLLKAIQAVREGNTFFSPAVAKLLLQGYSGKKNGGDAEDKYSLLTTREREVYQNLAEGKSNRVIAEALGLSIHTVETHRIRIMSKLNVHNMAELVLSAVRRGLVA